MQKRLIKNSAWAYAAKLAAVLLFFAADIIIARNLDIAQYAEWAFFFSILSMTYYVCWFGVNGSAKVFVSKTVRDTEERRACIRAGIRVRTAVTLALAVPALLLAWIAPEFAFFRDLTAKYPHLHRLLFMMAGITALNSFAEFYKETETGTQNYRGVFLLTCLEYGAVLAAGAVGAGLFHSTEATGAGFLAAYAAVLILGMILLLKWNGIRTLRDGAREYRAYAKKIFRYALPLAMIGIGGVILVEMDTMMLGMLSTPENVSNYAIAKQICTKASHINNALAMGTLTSFSVITAEDYQQKRTAFSRLTRINLALTLAAGAAMFFLAKLAIGILYGEQYLEAAGIIRMLVPYYLLYGISAFYALFLDFHEKAGKRSLWYLVMIGINFVLNLALIPRYGTTGACLATAVSLVPYTGYLLAATYGSVWREMEKAYGRA